MYYKKEGQKRTQFQIMFLGKHAATVGQQMSCIGPKG